MQMLCFRSNVPSIGLVLTPRRSRGLHERASSKDREKQREAVRARVVLIFTVTWLFIKFIARSAIRGGAIVLQPVGSVHPAHHVADLPSRNATEEPGNMREIALDEDTGVCSWGQMWRNEDMNGLWGTDEL
jgi:hypothetical protein